VADAVIEADFHTADLSGNLGRNSDVHIFQNCDIANGNIHQPIRDCDLGSRRSSEPYRQSPSHN
jgi:hypothetical protein